jgi:hypothetical protein
VFARYFNDIVEEISQEELSDETRENYDKVLASIDAGFQEKTDIHRVTKIDRAELDNTIAVMLDYGMIEALRQGGKTAVARGAAKVLYIRKEKPEVHELTYEIDDDEDPDEMAAGYAFPAMALRMAG